MLLRTAKSAAHVCLFFFNIFKKLSDNIINSNILDGLIYTASIYIVVFNVFSTNSVYIDVKLT